MQWINVLQSTATLAIFITAITPVSNCNATEPVVALPSANLAPYTLLDAKGKIVTTNARCAGIQGSDLIWEIKTDDGGIHDKDNVYRWGGNGAEKTGTIFFDDWDSLLNATNAEKLCGYDDWRVPTIDELKTLATNTAARPTINPDIFQLTLESPYWSVSTYQNYPEHAQTVDFTTGAAHYYNGFRGDRLPVRLVRSNKK